MSPGAEACVQLNQFEEAIVFCDKGLAVSFKHFTLPSTNTSSFDSALCVSKVWKMERKDTWALHAHIEGKEIRSRVIRKYKCRCKLFYSCNNNNHSLKFTS